MPDFTKNFINGAWTPAEGNETVELISPVTEQAIGQVALSSAADANRAVEAAAAAFLAYSRWSVEDRAALLDRIADGMEARSEELADAISAEIGCPPWLARSAQVPLAIAHVRIAAGAARTYAFDRPLASTMVRHVPVGVCVLISPWNFPASTITCKLAPALATGCTVVLKPSEFSPWSASLIAEIVDAAGAPAGVLNLVLGSGETVGTALSGHPKVSMVSITGSTRAGIAVARNAAETVKRVHQELGGKSPCIVLPGADLEAAVTRTVKMLMMNSGQGCSLPSRLLVPESEVKNVAAIVRGLETGLQPSSADGNGYTGPVVNRSQFERIQDYIRIGLEEGATALIGGPGRPEGFKRGFYVRPTVFADTTPDMRIVREEIFGPVIVIQAYRDVEDAIALANDTEYGLAGYVEAGSVEEAIAVADRLNAGQIILNGSAPDLSAPFGGMKQSGNGREYGVHGFEAFVEVKAIVGFAPAPEPSGRNEAVLQL